MSEVVQGNSQPESHWLYWVLPDMGDILFVLLISLMLFMIPSFIFGDGSTGWHIVTGDYILSEHRIPYQDLMSYTFHDKPWVAYEWLSDALMAAATRLGGLNLLAVLFSSSIAMLSLFLYDRCRKEGAHFALAVTLIIMGALISAVSWLVRPHIFTFFGVFLFTTKLEDFYRGAISKKHLWIALGLYMLLWVNTHPAFVLGLVLVGIYLASSITAAAYFSYQPLRTAYLHKARDLSLTLLALLGASLVNPYGPKLYSYIFEYLKGSSVLAATDEFLSPIFHGGFQPTLLELLFAALLIGLAVGARPLSLPRLLLCLAFSHLTLSAVRNMPLFVIVVLPAISQLFSKLKPFPVGGIIGKSNNANGADRAQPENEELNQPSACWRFLRNAWITMGEKVDENEFLCKKHLIPVVFCLLLIIASINGGTFMGIELKSGFDPVNKPTETVEYLREQEEARKLDPKRGFNYDNWGGYIRYKLGDNHGQILEAPNHVTGRVFIDDRADFYGEKFYYEYSLVSLVLPGWKDVLKKYDVQWILVPKNSRIGSILKELPEEWVLASSDKASVLYVRK